MNEVREKMEEEMLDIMKRMDEVVVDGESFEKLSKRLVEIGKIRNESLKIEYDYDRQVEREYAETRAKTAELEDERSRFKINTILDCAKIGTSILLFVGLAFAESRGTFTNLSTKNLFGGMRFGIKR